MKSLQKSNIAISHCILACACSLFSRGLASAQAFVPGCDVPFKAISTPNLGIDQRCGIDGGSSGAGKKAESNAKNNFCVKGTATPIQYATFTQLEAAVTERQREAAKTDRGVLKNVAGNLGEGTLVQFAGYLLDAHVSNVGKGELVNCETGGQLFNDVHIELVNTPDEDDACQSVTAEMSPHLRPESWTALPGMTIKRRIRVTGPLFFDGSHRACHGTVRPSPNRTSVWEIHPVYQFEVCRNKPPATCKVDDDAAWIPLDQWGFAEETTPEISSMQEVFTDKVDSLLGQAAPSAAEVSRLLDDTRGDLLSTLHQPELGALRDSLEAIFRQAREQLRLPLATGAPARFLSPVPQAQRRASFAMFTPDRSAAPTSLAAQQDSLLTATLRVALAPISKALKLLSSHDEQYDLVIDLCYKTKRQAGAKSQLTGIFSIDRRIKTDPHTAKTGDKLRLYRGLYDYTFSPPRDFKRLTGHFDFFLEPEPIIECELVPGSIPDDEAPPCHRRRGLVAEECHD